MVRILFLVKKLICFVLVEVSIIVLMNNKTITMNQGIYGHYNIEMQ